MSCEHKRIKSENCVISCMDCGEILPIDYIIGKQRIAAQNAAENAAKEPAEGNAPEPVQAAKKPTEGRKKATTKKK